VWKGLLLAGRDMRLRRMRQLGNVICPPKSSELGASVVSLKFIEQFDELKRFEIHPSEAEAHRFGDLCGTTEVVP
jgi:hypothetical protein